MYKVNHEELKSLIREYYETKLSLFVFGAFGIGKSFIVKEVSKELARERGREFIEWNKINKEEKDKVFNNPKDYFVLLDERLSEYDSCLVGDMRVTLYNGKTKKIEDIRAGDTLVGYRGGTKVKNKVVKFWENGESKNGIIRVELSDGTILRGTGEHKALIGDKYVKFKDLKVGDSLHKSLNRGYPSNIYNREILNEEQRKEDNQGGKRVCKKELSNYDIGGNREENWENCKECSGNRLLYGDTETGTPLYGRGEKIHKGELRNNEGKGDCESLGKKSVWFNFFRSKRGNTKNSRRYMGGEIPNNREPHRGGKGIFSGYNGWRGNFLTFNTKTTEGDSPLQTKDDYQQHGRETFRVGKREIECEGSNIRQQRQKEYKAEKGICNRVKRIQDSSNIKWADSLSSYKEGQSHNTRRLDRKTEGQNVEESLHGTRQKATFGNKKDEFKQVEICRIIRENENRQVFDITTTEGNYLAEGVVVHNSDIKGLPSFQEESEVLNWRIPYWAKFLTQKDSDGVLFFDEMNLASSLVISSVYKIIYDRIIGENKIEDNWLIMGAGNRDSDRAYTFSLPAPVRDRSGEVELLVGNKDNWTNWAVSNGIDSRIIAYINFKESNLYNVDFDNNQKYTTSRGWERTSKLIKDKKVDELFERLVCSSIGEGIGREFIGYCKLIGEVDLEGISKNPTKLKEIKDMGVRYMVISSLAEKFGKEEDYTFSDIIKVSKVLDEDNSAEFVGLLWNLCNSYTRPNKEGKTPFGIDNPKIVKKFYNGYLNTTIKEEEELLNKYGKYITGY